MKLPRQIIGTVCVLVWLIFVFFATLNWPANLTGQLLVLSAAAYVAHVLFAGYFLYTLMGKLDRQSLVFMLIIGSLIIAAPSSFYNYGLLAADFTLLFVTAMFLHQHALDLKGGAALQKLARYKIRLELIILIFIGIEALLIWILPGFTSWVAGIWLGLILIGDFYVICIDKIYRSKT